MCYTQSYLGLKARIACTEKLVWNIILLFSSQELDVSELWSWMRDWGVSQCRWELLRAGNQLTSSQYLVARWQCFREANHHLLTKRRPGKLSINFYNIIISQYSEMEFLPSIFCKWREQVIWIARQCRRHCQLLPSTQMTALFWSMGACPMSGLER